MADSESARHYALSTDDLSTGPSRSLSSRPAFSSQLAIAAAASTLIYAAISWLSWRFEFNTAGRTRPILAVMSLFACAFAVYVWATVLMYRKTTTGGDDDRSNVKLIVAMAVVFRVIMLFSLPIQEVDIYRYLWDGAVSNEGISPFAHTPLEVIGASRNRQSMGGSDSRRTEELSRLTALRNREPAMDEILSRVHFPELPTIYPATSQIVFSAVDRITPIRASLLTRVYLMKACLIGFDLATFFTVVALLQLLARPPCWAIAYAWCPLLMKEVAGSGHLDAIAVFLTTLTVFLATQLLIRDKPCNRFFIRMILVAVVFALAIAAKLYPVVLAPLFSLVVARRFGIKHVVAPVVTVAVLSVILLFPMMPGNSQASSAATDPSEGVTTFLKQWEMNDFLFLILFENLRPPDTVSAEYVPWFSVLPDNIRVWINDFATDTFGLTPGQAAFTLTRAITLVLFAVVAIGLAACASIPKDPAASSAAFCEASFLTLAWFWLLCPTQNPWYWTWALPLLPLAKGRAWIAVSGLVLIYYLRFWLDYHFEGIAVLGTPYRGVTFYDFVLTWVEFFPFFAWLAIGWFRRPAAAT